MKFKHDLEMWHEIKEFAKLLEQLANFNEIKLVQLCKSYEWDSDASEESCNNPNLKRGILTPDFNSKEECWKCPYYLKEEGKKKDMWQRAKEGSVFIEDVLKRF